MMRHLDDESLADIVLGLDTDDAAHATHLAECERCAASLASLRRAAGLLTSIDPAPQWQRPSAATWAAIAAEIDLDQLGREPDAAHPVAAHPVAAQPDNAETPIGEPLAADVPASVHSLEDSRRTRSSRRTPRLRQVPIWLAGAAAAGLVVGLLTGRSLWGASEPAPAPTVASVPLDTLDTKVPLGNAVVLRSSTEVDLRVQTHDLQAGNGYLEVWLINRDGKRMVSIGVLGRASSQTFVISQELIDQGYVIVDISREGFDDKPQHSGDSLVRGTLPI
jgi:hypothetical protein